MIAKFKALKDVTLDGVDYKAGDTFEAHDYLKEHFETSGIGNMVTGEEKAPAKPESKPKKDPK